MNQDILNLYQKAQNGGLNAQEVFWLEGQVATYPCFGMAYMILARHHFRNQSTIKNKALLKAAAYASNRTLLRHYLEDTLSPPKVKPVPVSEMKPILEKKGNEPTVETPAVPAIDLKKQSENPPAEEKPVEITSHSEQPTSENDPPPAEEKVEPTQENTTEPSPLVRAPEEVPEKVEVETVVEVPAEPIVEPRHVEAEPEAKESEIKQPETQVTQPEALQKTEFSEANPENSANPANSGPVVNWFLNMRVKLRADKYKILGKRLRASVANHAPALAAKAESAAIEVAEAPIEKTEQPTAEVTLPPIEIPVEKIEHPFAEAPIQKTEQPAAEIPVEKIEQPVPELVPPTTEEKADPPTAEVATPVLDVPAAQVEQPISMAETVEPVIDLPKAEESKREEAASEEDAPANAIVAAEETIPMIEFIPQNPQPEPETKKEPPKVSARQPEKEYEIGAFSSFTFLSEGETDDTEEVIDTGIATLESVEFQTLDAKDGSGEIIFEENDRIIEISVSPEALNKYFKGRLPSEPMVAFGEFKIELDELEYKPSEEVAPIPPKKEGKKRTHTPKKDDLIEKFIENEPSITRGKSAHSAQGDLAKDSSQLDDEWVTETLARIYEKQGNKAKAIKIYEKLRLRFPEKNDYFGVLIEKLKH